jgi:hypothetical protein
MKKGLVIGIIVVLVVALGIYFYSGGNSSDCATAGKISYDSATGEFNECCTGLTDEMNFPDGTPEECEAFSMMDGYSSICTDCGNGVCEEWENRCICPEDC